MRQELNNMGVLDIFKKFKRGTDARSERFKTRQRAKETVIKEGDENVHAERKDRVAFAESKTAAEVLVSPHVTEKSAKLSDGSVYVFKVRAGATKPQIKKAVSELYNVKAVSASIINQKPKTRFFRRVKGRKPGYKKAQVMLAKGEKIEFI